MCFGSLWAWAVSPLQNKPEAHLISARLGWCLHTCLAVTVLSEVGTFSLDGQVLEAPESMCARAGAEQLVARGLSFLPLPFLLPLMSRKSWASSPHPRPASSL